jgi:glycosyltransferase involved in cell wall biosynthesis
MRVLHVNGNGVFAGGTESYLGLLIRAQRQRGDTVAILHRDSTCELPVTISLKSRGLEADLAAVGDYAPDVVHVHDDNFGLTLERELHERYPIVRSLHSFGFGCASGERYFRGGEICMRAHGPGCLGNLVGRGCAHRIDVRPQIKHFFEVSERLPLIRAAQAVVVYSEFVRSIALINGVDRARCHVIPYCVDRPSRSLPPADERTVSYIGRINRSKGLDVLLRALAATQSAWDDLWVVGDGWYRERCERLSTRLGIARRVEFLGWRQQKEIVQVIRASRLVALPSRWPEPFGIVGIEAMAQSRPVVASNVGGIPDWLDDGETGLLVPAGDPSALATAIASVLDDEEWAGQLGTAAWRRVGRFSVAAHLEKLDRTYEQALQHDVARAGHSHSMTGAVR